MATNWRKLPTEVWINIFIQIDSNKTLVECRRACKEWDPLAERAIFSGKFVFPEPTAKLKLLHQHVSRKPTLGRYPREICMQHDIMERNGELQMSLLKLLVNPNITSISSQDLLSAEMFETLHQMLQQPPLSTCKLKMIPKSEHCNEQYWQALCLYKDLLRGARLDLDEMAANGISNAVYEQLQDFKSLQSLSFLRHSFGSLLELDGFLDKLPQLEELRASIDLIPGDYEPKSRAEMETWFNDKKITKNNSLKKLTMQYKPEPRYFDNLIEYLMLKYPLLKHLHLQDMEIDVDMKRLVTAVKHVPRLDLDNFFTESDESGGLVETVQQLKSDDSDVNIVYAHPEATACAELIYSGDKTIDKRPFFSIDIAHSSTNISHLDVLSQFATVDGLRANLRVFNRRLWGQFNESAFQYSLYDVLKTVPNVQELVYDDMQIKYEKLEAGSLILRDLTKLELEDADLDSRVLSQLSNIAPNLQSLFLTTCRLLNGNKVLKNLYHVNMQFTSFALLEIAYIDRFDMPPDNEEELAEERHYKAIRDNSIVNGNAFLHLQTSSATVSQQDHYFMLLTNSPALPLSAEEFKAQRKKTSTLFKIACKSLERLKIDLIGFTIDLMFDKNYNLTNGNWSCLQKKLDATESA